MLEKIVQNDAPLLLTKLRVPYGRENIQRKRLIQVLNDGLQKKITLISAPAGFGKTTLLIEWVRQTDLPVAWLSLDRGENDPFQFWVYFYSSIRILYPEIGDHALSILQVGYLNSINDALTFFINEIEKLSSQFVVILDDFHVVDTPTIHEALIFLIDHLPEQIRLILSSRTEPPWHLTRLRTCGELTEIHSENLCFTLDETAAFMKEIMKLDLSIETLRILNENIKGWVTGLQIAALSLQGRDDIPAFLQTFSGCNRFLCDYLLEEVVESLPNDIQLFLYQTSILEQLNADLCNSVTGRTNSQEILEKLEKDNMFIISLDDNRQWYQYHQFFVKSLRFHLNREYSEMTIHLYERAAIWYEDNGYFVDSINSFFAALNYSQVVRLINKIAADMIYQGKIGLLMHWLERFPSEILQKQSTLLIYRAWCLITVDLNLEVAQECLRQAENLLVNGENQVALCSKEGLSSTEATLLSCVNSFLARLQGNLHSSIDYAQAALRYLPEEEFMWRCEASWNLAEIYRYNGEVDQWDHALNKAITISWKTERLGAKILVMDNLAELQVVQGQLHLAKRTWDQALKYAEGQDETLPIICLIHSGLGNLHYEWNQLKIAKKHLLTAIELAKYGGMIETLLESTILLAQMTYIQDEREAALDMLHNIEPLIQTRTETKHAIRTKAYIAYWEYLEGNRDYFYNWVHNRHLNINDQPQYIREFEYFILSRVMIQENKFGDALKLLKRIQESGHVNGCVISEIQSLVLQAVTLEQQGETAKAFIVLEEALTMTTPGGFKRTFIESSGAMVDLLCKYLARNPQQVYVRQLLSAMSGNLAEDPKLFSSIEPLSEREIQILHLIASRLTSREIANELNISINTARTHIKNIYGKLDVHDRSEAAMRAEAMGL